MAAFREETKKPATVLAIGTANPPNCYKQADFPDFYFRATNSDHLTDLKRNFNRICERSRIETRYLHLTEEIVKENPSIGAFEAASLNVRHKIQVKQVCELGKEAARKAIQEWGQPNSKITHLIVSCLAGVDMPGADYQLTNLLHLNPSVKRFMFYHLGCYAGGTILRLAKDIAENNKGARVLIVCSEMTPICFRGPSEAHIDSMVGQAIFGEGAAAVVVGADPDPTIEKPIFELVSTAQTIIPESHGAIEGHLLESGLSFHLSRNTPLLISNHLQTCLLEAFTPLGITNWNSLFWITHPGGPGLLDDIEAAVGLQKEKLRAARKVLNDYGNMSGTTVLFVMDEMRKKSVENGYATTGEGLEWGVLFGFGPGITVETVVLRSVPRSRIETRYLHLTEEIVKENPSIGAFEAASLNVRHKIQVKQVCELGKEAARKAIQEWGQPNSKITHLIVSCLAGVDMPGADYQLTNLLHLNPSVKRFMFYHLGCYAGGTILRLAKDIAENNKGARVLIVCSEMTPICFRGPSEAHIDSMVGQAIFGEGAAAVVVGADPDPTIEKPIFELVSTAQTIIPESHGAIEGHLLESGLSFHLSRNTPLLISNHLQTCLLEAFTPLGITNWNSLFWITHPGTDEIGMHIGGPGLLDDIEAAVGLQKEKLRAARKVLNDYGNMSGTTVLFVMDEMRKKSVENGYATTGEGLEWGVLFGFGPGITVETVVLRSVPVNK
ncbi:hypothetical protein V2J09_005969 [Rumex salicifolius]